MPGTSAPEPVRHVASSGLQVVRPEKKGCFVFPTSPMTQPPLCTQYCSRSVHSIPWPVSVVLPSLSPTVACLLSTRQDIKQAILLSRGGGDDKTFHSVSSLSFLPSIGNQRREGHTDLSRCSFYEMVSLTCCPANTNKQSRVIVTTAPESSLGSIRTIRGAALANTHTLLGQIF